MTQDTFKALLNLGDFVRSLGKLAEIRGDALPADDYIGRTGELRYREACIDVREEIARILEEAGTPTP